MQDAKRLAHTDLLWSGAVLGRPTRMVPCDPFGVRMWNSNRILLVLTWQPHSQCEKVPQISSSVPVLSILCDLGPCAMRSSDTPSSSTWLRRCMCVRGTGPTSWKALGGAGAAFGGGPRPTSRFFQDFTTPSDSVFLLFDTFSLFSHMNAHLLSATRRSQAMAGIFTGRPRKVLLYKKVILYETGFCIKRDSV